MRVEVVRRGGLAGVAVRATLDTATLDGAQREAVEQAARALPFSRPLPAAGRPDGFRYELTVTDEGGPRSAQLHEDALPGPLRGPLRDALAGGDLE